MQKYGKKEKKLDYIYIINVKVFYWYKNSQNKSVYLILSLWFMRGEISFMKKNFNIFMQKKLSLGLGIALTLGSSVSTYASVPSDYVPHYYKHYNKY